MIAIYTKSKILYGMIMHLAGKTLDDLIVRVGGLYDKKKDVSSDGSGSSE